MLVATCVVFFRTGTALAACDRCMHTIERWCEYSECPIPEGLYA